MSVAATALPVSGRPVPGIEKEVLALLEKVWSGKLLEAAIVRPLLVRAVIDRADLLPVCTYLKEQLGFEHLGCVSAVDWKDHFESVYHVENLSNGCVVQLHARIPHDDPKIASVCSLWNAANYHEREAWDLMGLVYEGHPNLERILLPADFKFHPLRKDFPQEVDRQYVSRRKLRGGK
ncbi:MAG TPA: NADH-quinone oxidoreductase subunit C [Thermoplasmata archaeon]|jgi:NADH-quinone oxidoreductase subunit C